MKKIPSFSALFTSILMVLSVASATWAQDNKVDVSLTYDDDDGTYYVNMPYLHDKLIIGTLTLTANDLSSYADPSTGEISFKVYDDGGKSGTYNPYPTSVLQIIVPEGYVLTLNGQVKMESLPYAYLNVYDAAERSDGALIAENLNSGNIGPYVSSGNALTLYFTAYNEGDDWDGLDLTVGVHLTHAITVNTLVTGGVVSGMTSAYENQTATLTATPENGYAFVKAVVIDGEGNSVDVTRSGNTFSFAMPTSDVSVTPYFADPTVLSFDENGCLNNGTHFHVECENSTCTISQGLQDNPQEGVSDFRCWSDMVQYIEEDEGRLSSTIALGTNLNLGGYDEDNAKCRMSFVPFGSNHAGLDGSVNKYTIDGFCNEKMGEGNSAAMMEVNSVQNITFANAHVRAYDAFIIKANTLSGVTVDNATVVGDTAAGCFGKGIGSLGDIVVKNSNISVGPNPNNTVYAGVLTTDLENVTWLGSVTLQNNTLTGVGGSSGGSVGGLAATVSGSITGVSIEETSVSITGDYSYAGGLAGKTYGSASIYQCSFDGSVSGYAAGGIVGSVYNHDTYGIVIKNTYTTGSISGSESAGYIVGELNAVFTSGDSLYNNYHFGSDEVELGIGGSTYTAELWSAGSGSVFSNVRNASGSLNANTLGYHKIDWYDNGIEGSSVDFFSGTLGEYEAVIRTVNGVVAETDMTSGFLAAMMNYNLESKGESAVWISKSNSLPTFATSSDEPNHMVALVVRGLPDPTGFESVEESYLKDNGPSEGGTVAYGFTAYTDASGSLTSTKFDDVLGEIEKIKGDLGNDAMLVDDNGNIVSASMSIDSYQVWHFTKPSTYDIVYKYCISANNCVPFENVTETALGFMTPKIDSYAESAEAPLQLVPNVVDYSEVYHTASGLKFTFELQDESGNTIQGIASGDATPQGTEIWSFEDIAQKIRAAGIENAKTIVLKYSTPSTWYGEFPLLEVENPKLFDFEVDVYAYDRNSSMVQVIESSASGDYAYGSVEYGAAIKISKIKEVIGYNFDNTYSIAYQYKATLNGCTPSEQPVTVPNAEKTLGTVDELVEKMSACGTAEWVVDNLNTESATDLVILDNAKMASFTAQRKYGNNVSERVVITPNYTLVQYNLSFNLNLPDDLGEDSSSVFLGRNWAAVKTMDVEHPTLPKVYTTSCPKMKGWSWVADTSVFQEWDTKYVTTFSDRYGNSFVNYATFDEENGNAASAFGYWPSSCTDSDVPGMPLVFAAMEDNSPVLNYSKFHGNIVLKQSVDGTNDISHKSKMVQNVDAAGYHYQTTLPVVDDTLSFIVEASAEKGYTIEGITFVGTEKENHGIDETDEEVTLGFDEPELTEATTHVTSTLAVNTAMLTAMQFNVTFNYMRYNVEFVRPTDESAVGVSEVYVPDTYSNDQWMDGHVYTAEDVSNYETNVMPQLYATGKCMVWSENPSYLATDSVYTAFNWIAVNEFGQETKLYPIALTSEMDSDHCSGGPTETFTVTANVNLPDGLARLELRQVIGVEGDGDHADTIKHEMVQDGTSSKFTLEIPKVAALQAVTESYVPFTFEIHAVTKDGYTTYSNSYYRKITDAGEEISEIIAGGKLTTTGVDEEFYVDLVDGDYTIAFDTTGWDHFVVPFSGNFTNYRYDIYIADEDIDQFETYAKPDGSTRLPKFYAATDEGANNTSQTWVIAGWTIYADSAFCMLGSRMENGTCVTSSSKNLFTTFSGDLIVAAKKASLDDGFFENKVIKLYPVWTSAGEVTYAGINKIKASCPEQTDGCDDNDRPMVLTASQTFTLNGESITLKHSSDVFIPVPWEPGNRSITLDIDFQANPGYEFNSVTLQNASEDEAVYTPADKKLRLITQTHETNVNFVPVSLSYTPYTLTFDISSLENELVAFGQSWGKVNEETGKAVMNVGTANEFPNLYVLYGYTDDYDPVFNELYWTKEQAPEDEQEQNAWYSSYITSSRKQPFNSDLVTQYFGENSTETATTVYPMIVSSLADYRTARGSWTLWLWNTDLTSTSYHGRVVISQTWNDKTYSQESMLYYTEAGYLHRLIVPNADDTLLYKVSLDPDPGYAMKLDTMPPEASYRSFGWSDDDGGSANPPEGENWGYNLDPEVMTLKVQPSRMSSWANEAYVSFTPLHYNVEFSRPTDAEVFVASKWVSDNKYEVDWFESQTDVTVNNIKTPILYDENGCQVYWKVKDSEAHIDTGIVGELVYMTSTETLETAINVLVPDTDESNRNCDNAETYKQTLTVEGEGTILLEQVIGDAPESPEDPAQVVLAHSFVEDEATGVLTLNVPAAYNEVGPDFLIEQTGVKFRVVAVPAENYTLDKISYETAKNGNVMTVTVEDSAEVNVMESLPWTVKFKSLAPIYVTYDLSLVYPDDSADTYLPTNATKSESLELASNADTVSFWKPYRASTCFQGWSTTAAANYTADDSAYTTFNAGNFTEFSTNPDNPTTLYAIWGDCPEIRNLWTVENSQMNATLVLYQLFGDDTLFHEVSNRRGVTLEGDSFDVYIDPVRSAPKSGYHYAADAKYELSYQYALPVTEGSDPVSETVEVEPDAEKGGVWHLTSVGIPSSPTYIFTTDVEMMNYLIVFDVNAGDAPVFYGTDWAKEKTLMLGSSDEDKVFPQDLRRTDACFEGWVIPGIEEPEIYSNFDEVVDALKDVMATVETVQNDEGESVDRTYYTLSAQWNSNCTPETFKIFSGMTEGQGTFQVSQNPDAENAVWMEVPEDGLVIPELEGLSLAVKFTGADTYETGDVITGVKADAENAEQLFEIENGKSFTVDAEQPDVKLNVEANLIEMNFALDAGYDDVFYGPGFSWNWSSEGVAFGAALPANLYRAGYKLAGWKFDNEETPMLYFGEDFAAAYSAYAESHGGDYPDTLHAVWTVSGVIPAYSLQLTEETLDQNAGVLTLSQTIGDSTIVHVFEDGMLNVPMVEDLALTVNFAIDTAHSFDGETPITLKSYFTEDTFGSYATGDELVVHTEVLGEAGTVMVNVATKVDSYEFAFDINVGEDDQVFYGKDWFASKSYDMSEEELDSRFPASAYQTQNCLGGFAFTAMEPLEDGYTITMPDVKFYTGIDSAFIADYKALEEKPTTLYAVWLKPGVHCRAITSNVMISALNASEEGEFILTNADMEIKLPASEETAAVQVPVADDLEFTVTFTPTSAYDFDAETGTITISLVDGYDYTLVNAKTYSFAKNATLKATPTLKAVAFDLNANAGEASVFYGKEYAKTWTSEGAAYGAELPKNIYRADAKFVGWAFAALEDNATEGFFTKFDKDFMDAYAAQETVPTTLYAVWKTDDERATYKIASASTDAGDLLVAQFVGEDSLGYAVTAAGLTVPAESDLEFKAYFTVNMEHTLASVSEPLTLMNADEEETPFGTIANGGAFTLQGNTSVVANTSDDAYEFVFDVNAGDATVFYGTNWVENLVVEMTDATASRDFPKSIYRTDKCLQGFSFDSENQETYYEGITEEFVTAFKDGGYSSPKTLYAVWGDCPDDHKNVSVTVANTAAEGWFSLGNYVGDIENEFDLNEDHESLLVPVADDLEFTVSFVSGGAYTFNAVINVLDADAETPTLVKELHSTDAYTFTQNVKLQAVTEFVKVELVFDLNVDDANVFFTSDFDGLTWNVNDYGDEFPSKIVRADKVFAGWGFTREASEGFTVYDNDFVVAYNEFSDSHDLTNVPVTLYALWIDAPEAIETYHVSLQNSYDGKLTLSQSNAGVVTEYEVGTDGIDIPVNANREFRVTFDADYAYSLAAGTPITISEISSMGNVTDETSIANGGVFEFDANSVISVEMGADKYILAFDVNADDADVFYGTNWFASKTYDMADEDLDAKFPTSVYQNGKCLSGYTFDAAGTGDVFTEINPDFISAYKSLEEAPEKLYAVWYTGDCDQASVTVASGNKDHEATFVLTNAGKDYEVSEENPVEVPVASDLEFTVAFTAGSAYSTDDKFSVVMGNSTDAQVSGDTYTFTRNAELLANVNLKFVYVAFNMNAGDANVFYNKNYENVWISEDVEYGTELPKNVYRADADLLGWAFEAIEDDAAEVWFTKFDNDFVEAYAAASAGQGDDPTPLYAVWKTNAERATYTITSTEETLGAGNLVVAQWAFADSVGYAVGADGLKVPAENDLIFRAYFEPLNTHSVVGDLPVALDVDGEVTNVFVGQDFVLAGNTEITVATENDVYVLAFDANADGATLFYGDNWFSGKTYSPADAEEDLNFPTSLYRTDKCLDGFAFNADESVVYKSISDEFITEFKERELTSPVTLVAVWKNCPETYANYTVAAKDASEGVFTLTNKYGEIANKFEVGSEALVIPAAEDLTFSVTFAENVTVDYENKVSVLAGDETVAMVDDGATVSFSQNSELKAVASVLNLTFAFDANKAANDTVFYGTEWSATKSYDLAEEGHSREFPTAYQTSKCLAGFAFSKTATESEAFQEVGVDFVRAYKALEVKPTTLYAVWTTEDCNHGYVVLRSGNTEAEGSFTISDAVNSYELSAGSLMAVPTHVVDFKVTFHEGHAYELENIDLLDDDLNSYSGFANGAEYSFDMNTVLKANVEPKSKGLVFALNADDATVFYGTSYDPKWFENLMNGDFYNDNLPSGIYRNDAVFVGWSFTQMSGVAEGSKYFTKIDDDFYEAFKNHAETRENFDTPDTLYAVWKSAPNREIYTVTVGNKASEGKFRLTNASGGLSNEFLVDATTMLVIPAENDLVFSVSFVSASETAEYEGISVISTTGTQIAVIEMGDEYTFRKDVMLRAISYMPTMEFALDVNAGDADVFYESDFGFKWWASSYGQYLPTGIYRTDAKLVGWSLDKNATPDKAFKEIDDAFNEAVESYMEQYGEDLIGDISEGDFDLSKIQEMYGMDFAQMSRGPVLYAVWEKANVKTVSVKSNSLRQGTLTLQQLVDDSTFTFVVGEKGLKVPYVEGGLEFRAHFEANESHLLNSGKSLVWNAAAADTTKNDEFVLVSEATSFDALVKVVGFNLAFNAESKETLFYGDDWTSGKKVIAKGTGASQFPTMVYSASRCLVGWTLKNDSVAYTEMQDELANKLYEKYPKLTDTTKINMYALWSDSPDQCSALMTRVSVEQDKGEVMLVEKTGESTEVVHKFNEKGSMMLPSDIVSAEWTLRSAPDSSYALDSLTIVRNDKLLAVLREGGNLPGNMDNAVFKAHFSKANKTPVEIVERHFAQSGNAIQLNIKASEFEVTRGVEARVRVFDVKDDSVVLDSLLGDSVAMGFESEVVLRMKRTGDYKVVLTLEDEKESDAFEQEFGVKSSIASVGKDGWQMVSLAAVDTSAINWTSDDQVFYWWDEFGNGGDYWQYKRYNRGDSVVATRGAWYSSLDSLPLVLKRDIEDDGEDAVWKLDSIHSGWNLVANTHGWEVSLFAGHADEEKDVDEESEISFYRYNSETADYEETKYLKPYEAVWAKVGKKKNWKVSAAPVFAKEKEREPQPEKPEGGRMLPKRVLAKASTKDRWVLQVVLSDKNGKQDAWNILGAGNNPFSAEEPPESMGDHVNLSIVEGKRALAKSIKSASDEMEWTVALSASNDRVGYLTLVGIDDVNAFGYRVFVTVDGNTTEMKDGVPLQVLLKSNAKTATVRVAPAAKVVAQNSLKGLRSARLGGKLKVSFEATGLAGTNARVDLLDMKGHVMSTVNAKTLEGTNALVLDAPKSGLYMLRVRAGSQQQAAKVMVK